MKNVAALRAAGLAANAFLVACTAGYQGTDNGVPYFDARAAARSAGVTDPQNTQPLAVTDGWQPGETLVRSARSRSGTTPEGYAYTIHAGGTASLTGGGNSWTLDCSKDAMSDQRNCALHAGAGNGVFIYFSPSGEPQTFCVFGHNFPGRSGAVRMDSGSPVLTDDRGCIPASRVVPKMLSASSVTTRRVEWPNDWNVDTTTSLAGFSRSVELGRFITKNIDRLAFGA